MTERRTVFRNTGILAGARVIERVGNLVIALLISRRFGVAALGTYAIAIAYYQLIATAGEMGSTNLLIREIAKDRSRTNSYLVHAAVLATLLSGVIMALAWTVVPHLGYSQELRLSLMIVVLAIAPGVLNTIQEAVFVAHQRVEFQTLTTLGGTAVTIALSWFLLGRGHGVAALLGAFVAVEYIVTLVYFALIHWRISAIRLDFRLSEARALVREIRVFAGSSLLGAAFARPEIIILSLMAADRQVGYYIAALKLVDLWQFLPQVYMVNVFPLLSRSYHAADGKFREIQDRAITSLLALGLPLCVGLLFAAPLIITTVYGEKFGPSVMILRLLAVNVLFYCLQSVLWRVLAARGEQGRVLRVQVVASLVRIAIGFVLIVRFGAVGAAVAMPAGLALHTAMLAVAVQRNGARLEIIRQVWRFAASAAVMGVAVVALSSWVNLPVMIVTAGAIYAVALVALGAAGPGVSALRRLSPSAAP